MKRRILFWGLLVIFAGTALFAGYRLLRVQLEYRAGEKSYEALTQYVHYQEPTVQEGAEVISTEPQEEVSRIPEVDFEALRQINPDVVGWILVEDTNINYPIVRGNDNERYLTQMFDGKYNPAGAVFMDCGNDPSWRDKNTVLYGHNMKNNTMFAQVTGYQHPSWYNAHPTGLLITPEGSYELVFFAGYTAWENDNAWDLTFRDAADFGAWLNQAKSKSTFSAAEMPGTEDRIVTLSTCSHDQKGAWYVLLGYLRPIE